MNLGYARDHINDGDLLLFRSVGIVSRLIRIAGRGEYSHAAKAQWWGDNLFCCEVRELKGGRAVTLESQVKKYPSLIDVFETNPGDRWQNYKRPEAGRYMRRLTGCDYGYFSVLKAALLHIPVWRWLVRPSTNDKELGSQPPFCSEACAMADRIGGGVDPVPNLSDRITEPSDLARTTFYRYRFTLVG